MTDKEMVIIKDVFIGDRFKANQFAKQVEEIDRDAKGGFAFEGNFIPHPSRFEVPILVQMPVGAIILSVGYIGSWRNGETLAHVSRVDNDGNLILLKEFKWSTAQKPEIINFVENILEDNE